MLRHRALLRDLGFGNGKLGLVAARLTRDKPPGLSEETIHLLQRYTFGLREESPEEDGVGNVADDK
jgi:hypothetical protein